MAELFQVVLMVFGISVCYIAAFLIVYFWDKYKKIRNT